MHKEIYNTLVKIIDELRLECSCNFELYKPEMGKVSLVQARSRGLIHFFIKSHFGILDFDDRESLITEGSQDGGIDAYYIDTVSKKVYLIQTKFRQDSHSYKTTDIKN